MKIAKPGKIVPLLLYSVFLAFEGNNHAPAEYSTSLISSSHVYKNSFSCADFFSEKPAITKTMESLLDPYGLFIFTSFATLVKVLFIFLTMSYLRDTPEL